MEHYLKIENITKTFPGVKALDKVNLFADLGQVHAILGENGAGKSTLMKILSGVYQADEGDIFIQGDKVHFANTKDAESAGIAIIYQELNLVPIMTVAENIFLGKEPLNKMGLIDYKRMSALAEKQLEKLGVPIPVDVPVNQLKIGEQQLVEIAKALSLDAKVVIMDEPTSALSDKEVESLFKIIEVLKNSNVAVLYISHKLEEIFTIADQVTVLRDGQYIDTKSIGETETGQLINMMVGRDVKNLFPKHQCQPGNELLKVQNLSIMHPEQKNRHLLNNISFQLKEGEILGIAGLMGSGRTELLMSLFGAPPGPVVSGQIAISGTDVQIKNPEQAINNGIALVTEDRKSLGLFLQLSVKTNASIANLGKFSSAGVLHQKMETKVVSDYIEQLQIKTPGIDAVVETLSGGNQQKVILAKWLMTQPKILLLDDPTRGIDVGAKEELYLLMNKFAKEGMGIILVSSELPELLAMSDRILVLNQGNLTAEFSAQQVTEQKIMFAATHQNRN